MSEDEKIETCSTCGIPLSRNDIIFKRTMCKSCRAIGQETLKKLKSGMYDIKPFSSPYNLKK